VRKYQRLIVVAIIVFVLGLSACKSSNSLVADSVAGTLSSIQMSTSVADLQTSVADLQTSVADLQTNTATSGSLTPTNMASSLDPTFVTSVPTPQPVLVIETALCLKGPGDIYEVVSSIQAGTHVELLGRDNTLTHEWLVIQNPKYKIPCWMLFDYLQVDPNTDLTSLQIFNPPPPPPLVSSTPRKQDTGYPNP
jgi:hypothetical protein